MDLLLLIVGKSMVFLRLPWVLFTIVAFIPLTGAVAFTVLLAHEQYQREHQEY